MLRITHSRIPDMFGQGSDVVEHVTLSDVLEAWLAVLEAAGIHPQRPDADAALRDFLAIAEVIRLSTPGDVYRAESAKADMARYLRRLGIELAFHEPVPPIVH